MKRQLPHESSPCASKGDQHCYCSSDGRFQIRNTWCVDNIREPNWLLIDHITGRTYRFFVRQQAEQKMEALLAKTT